MPDPKYPDECVPIPKVTESETVWAGDPDPLDPGEWMDSMWGSWSGGGFLIDGGFGMIQAPVSGQVPVEPIPPPPPPQINNIQELRKYWQGIKEWILSKGDCAKKLGGYINSIENLLNSNRLMINDVRQSPNLLNVLTSRGTTVGQELATQVAVTTFEFSRARGHRLIRADIYVGADFFNSSGEWQGMTFMHELLHAVLKEDDQQLQSDFNTGGKGMTAWIEGGCK